MQRMRFKERNKQLEQGIKKIPMTLKVKKHKAIIELRTSSKNEKMMLKLVRQLRTSRPSSNQKQARSSYRTKEDNSIR